VIRGGDGCLSTSTIYQRLKLPVALDGQLLQQQAVRTVLSSFHQDTKRLPHLSFSKPGRTPIRANALGYGLCGSASASNCIFLLCNSCLAYMLTCLFTGKKTDEDNRILFKHLDLKLTYTVTFPLVIQLILRTRGLKRDSIGLIRMKSKSNKSMKRFFTAMAIAQTSCTATIAVLLPTLNVFLPSLYAR
jgi:hypothetical protein